MFLSKVGSTGKALCKAYKEEASVRMFLAHLNNGDYKITYYFNKDEETLVYEAFTDKGQYIFLEVSGDGKPVEHVDRYTTILGLDDEQKALYVYLFETENKLMEEDKDSLDEIYKPVSSQIKPIMPLSGAQIGKRAKIRRDFLKYIESKLKAHYLLFKVPLIQISPSSPGKQSIPSAFFIEISYPGIGVPINPEIGVAKPFKVPKHRVVSVCPKPS